MPYSAFPLSPSDFGLLFECVEQVFFAFFLHVTHQMYG